MHFVTQCLKRLRLSTLRSVSSLALKLKPHRVSLNQLNKHAITALSVVNGRTYICLKGLAAQMPHRGQKEIIL